MLGRRFKSFAVTAKIKDCTYWEDWLAEDSVGQQVVIRIFDLSFIDNNTAAEYFTKNKEKIQNLAHPHLRKVYDFGVYSNRIFCILEFVRGIDFNTLISKKISFSQNDTLRWWNQCVKLIWFIHQKDFIHGFINPSNIILEESGNIKIDNFLIRELLKEQSYLKDGLNQPYISPELSQNYRNLPKEVDYYSLGVSFINLLSGKINKKFIIDISKYAEIPYQNFENILYKNIPAYWIFYISNAINIDVKKRKLIQNFNNDDIVSNNDYLSVFDSQRNKRNHENILAFRRIIDNKKFYIFVSFVSLVIIFYFLFKIMNSGHPRDPKLILIDSLVKKYDGIGSFSNGLIPVSKNQKWGFVDTSGKIIIPIKYDSVSNYIEGVGIFVKKDNKYFTINTLDSCIAGCEIDTLNSPEILANMKTRDRLNFILRKRLGKDWHIMTDKEAKWDAVEYKFYINPERKKGNFDYPYIVQGDFKGIGNKDFAVNAYNARKNISMLAIIWQGSNDVLLLNEEKLEYNLLELYKDKEVQEFPFDGNLNSRIVHLIGDGIYVIYPESSSHVVYWDGNEFKAIWDSD